MILKKYSNTYHAFDWPGVDKVGGGGKLKMLYNPEAAADATEVVKTFLEKYVGI